MTAELDVISPPKPGGCIGARHVVVCLMFLGTTVGYAARVSMSVGIVAMTGDNDFGYPVFKWDRTTKDMILSSFFWGYILLQIPAGMLAARFGGKLLVFVAIFSNGLINLFVPIAANHGGWTAVVVCRILMGLTQGLLYPSFHGLLGHWAPASERSRMGTLVYSGAQLGTIFELILAGFLASSSWGWPSVYYSAGIICLVWSAIWLLVGASTPADCKWISKEERKYIETNAGSHDISDGKGIPTPWRKIWTSLPFLSILFAHAGQSLGFWTLLTEMPTYMKEVLDVNVKESSLLSALPYIAMYILSLIFSCLAEFLTNKNVISNAASRKIFNTIAFWGPAAALLVLSYLPRGHVTWAVIILTATVGLNGAHYVGFLISHIDLSPNLASTLMGITNGLGNIMSILAPLSVSLFVQHEENAAEWRKVFFISIAFYFLSNLFYLLFMSGDVQDWNEPQPSGGTGGVENGIERRKSSSKETKRPSITSGDHQL